jgi:hypothetical protein
MKRFLPARETTPRRFSSVISDDTVIRFKKLIDQTKVSVDTLVAHDIEIFMGKKLEVLRMRRTSRLQTYTDLKPYLTYIYLDYLGEGGHVITAILFPRERCVDLLSTYETPLEIIDNIKIAFKYTLDGVPTMITPIVYDVSCSLLGSIRTRNAVCTSIQPDPEGWCQAWMIWFSREMSRLSNEAYWNQPWEGRKKIYVKLYDKITDHPDFNKPGFERNIIWNRLLKILNSTPSQF